MINDLYEKFFEKDRTALKEIQRHNFNQYLRSVCNLPELEKQMNECNNYLKSNAKTKPIEELLEKENECLKKESEYEVCNIVQQQLKQIFHNRQKKYISQYSNLKKV